MRPVFFGFCCLILFLSAAQLASPARADSMSNIPASVSDLRLFEHWEQDGKTGVYRGIVAIPEPGKASFTLQWLALGPNGALESVEHSMPVPELTKLGGMITDYRSEVDSQGLTIFLDVQESAGAVEDTYVIYVNGPADYVFESASN